MLESFWPEVYKLKYVPISPTLISLTLGATFTNIT